MIKRTTDLRQRLFLMLILLSPACLADDTVHCRAEHILDCAPQISPYFSSDRSQPCSLSALEFQEDTVSQMGFYALTCSNKKFFLKATYKGSAEESSFVQRYLSQNAPKELNSHIVTSVGNVLVSHSSGSRLYSVFPFVEGKTFAAIKSEAFRNDSQYPLLARLYHAIGVTLGELHNTGISHPGIIDKGGDLTTLTSHLVHNDLHSSNILISKNQRIFFIDNDGLFQSIAEPRLLTNDIHSVALDVLPTAVLLFKNPSDVSTFIAAFPQFVTRFIDGYCSSMTTLNHHSCVAQTRHTIMTLLRSTRHKMLSSPDYLFQDDVEPSAVVVDSDELENRLQLLL